MQKKNVGSHVSPAAAQTTPAASKQRQGCTHWRSLSAGSSSAPSPANERETGRAAPPAATLNGPLAGQDAGLGRHGKTDRLSGRKRQTDWKGKTDRLSDWEEKRKTE